MKQPILALTALALAVNAQAGGFENARLDTAFMYDEGNLISIGGVRKDFSVTGDSAGTTNSLIGDRNAVTIAAKYQVNDKLSLGVTAYDSGAVHVKYKGAGGALTGAGPIVNLTSDSIALLGRYQLNDNLSFMAGARYDTFEVADGDIFSIFGGGVPSVQSDSDIVPVASIAYLNPEIALRVELLYQGKSSVAMPTTCSATPALGIGCAAGDSTGGLPEFLTLNFQTGIAEDTLLFGSVHKGKWSASQLSVSDTENTVPGVGSLTGPTSSFKNSTEYSIGLGRRLTDSLSVSASYNWDNGPGKTTSSLFTVANGYKGVTLGAKYTIENIELSAGYNYTQLGDITTIRPRYINNLKDNDVKSMGAKVTVRF